MIWHFRVQKQETLKALTSMLHIKIGFLQTEAYCRQLQRAGKEKYCNVVKEELRIRPLPIILLVFLISHIKWFCSLQAPAALLLATRTSGCMRMCA